MSKDRKNCADKELRLMEVSEDSTSMFNREYLRDKFIMPPAWDDRGVSVEAEQNEGPVTLH